MLKRIFLFMMFGLICFGTAYSQQITRIAVVDLPRVYTVIFPQSRAVREFEERSAKVQSDINRYTNEIQSLRAQHAEAVLQGKEADAVRLEGQIIRRTEYLREFYQTKTAELETQRNNLMQSSQFLKQVDDEIKYIAESEGYYMVINLKDNTSILWYSRSIDITDKLIQSLQTKTRN